MSDTAPTFIACGARSGSTLLRWLIDTHPEVACPGETDVAVLLNSYMDTVTALSTGSALSTDPPLSTGSALSTGAQQPEATPVVPEATPVQRARAVVDDLMSGYLTDQGKARWCDKSLSNALHLDLLSATWPGSRFILLHRHCMDFVLSGLEASPWGLAGYSFAQFAPMSPTDSVVALTAYWIDRTTKLLAFEDRFPDRCLRVRYEDLVSRTEDVISGIWGFMGVDHMVGAEKVAFDSHHDAHGPADYKVWYTQRVHSSSIGRGAKVPPGHVAGAVRSAVNELSVRLGYATVDDNWGCGGIGPAVETADQSGSGEANPLVIDLRLLQGHVTLWRSTVDLGSGQWVESPGIGAEGLVGADGTDGSDGLVPPTRVVAIEIASLAGMCSGTENIGTALRNRTVRYYGPLLRNFAGERGVFERLAAFLVAKGPELLGPTGPIPSLKLSGRTS